MACPAVQGANHALRAMPHAQARICNAQHSTNATDRLPCRKRAPPSYPRPGPMGFPYRILVVDDDPDMRAYLRLCLVAQCGPGTVIDDAVDGLDALDVAHAHAPDLIITDLVMPRMDGQALCRAIRADARLGATPLLLISGADAPPDALAAGDADAFLSKPFNTAGLRLHTQRLLPPPP